MNYNISKNQLNTILYEMKNISRQNFVLYTAQGDLLADTMEEHLPRMESIVTQFASSLAETQVVQDWIFFRVVISPDYEYILLTERTTNSDQAYIVGRMAANQLRHMIENSENSMNVSNFMIQMIHGELSEDKIAEYKYQLHLNSASYMIYVISLMDKSNLLILELLKNLFAVHPDDYLVELNGSTIVLMKAASDIAKGDFEKYAHSIVENLQMEAMTNVWVGYAGLLEDFANMHQVYCQAAAALYTGMKFHKEDHVFCYYTMGLSRLIEQLPAEECRLYLEEILGENAYVDFDDETISTINCLFENNLNISETARKLYIHRNTLVYRLERIAKRLGLDIRTFEDAMLFKIAMMVRIHLNQLKTES